MSKLHEIMCIKKNLLPIIAMLITFTLNATETQSCTRNVLHNSLLRYITVCRVSLKYYAVMDSHYFHCFFRNLILGWLY